MITDEDEKELRTIETKLFRMRAAKPAHGHGSKYESELFELEEELYERRRELGLPKHGD